MQSWGIQSQFAIRDTQLEPTKSGVLGLLCAALGFDRELYDVPSYPVCLKRLSQMKMGVRVDNQGMFRTDYHTAQGVQKSKDGKVDSADNTVLSHRQYLSDADFLVGLESDSMEQLSAVHHALRNPFWPLALGRKAFVPSSAIYLADGLLKDVSLCEALSQIGPFRCEPPKLPVRYAIENRQGSLRNDVPVGPFSQRLFGTRRVEIKSVEWGEKLHVS